MTTYNIPVLAAEFAAASPALDDVQQRLELAMFRLLGQGQPVPPERLAEHVGLTVEEVTTLFDELPEFHRDQIHRDQQGRVIANAGLTLEPTSHVLEVDGQTLYAWCALDTLFIPELLARPARIHSTCPETGATISLRVDASGAHDITPNDAVMSLHSLDRVDSRDVIGTFCCFVHFFASEQAAQQWTTRTEGSYVVSIAEGFEYGRLGTRAQYGTALTETEA